MFPGRPLPETLKHCGRGHQTRRRTRYVVLEYSRQGTRHTAGFDKMAGQSGLEGVRLRIPAPANVGALGRASRHKDDEEIGIGLRFSKPEFKAKT